MQDHIRSSVARGDTLELPSPGAGHAIHVDLQSWASPGLGDSRFELRRFQGKSRTRGDDRREGRRMDGWTEGWRDGGGYRRREGRRDAVMQRWTERGRDAGRDRRGQRLTGDRGTVEVRDSCVRPTTHRGYRRALEREEAAFGVTGMKSILSARAGSDGFGPYMGKFDSSSRLGMAIRGRRCRSKWHHLWGGIER